MSHVKHEFFIEKNVFFLVLIEEKIAKYFFFLSHFFEVKNFRIEEIL